MIPASLMAGALGLLLGPNGLGYIQFSKQLETYSSILIVLVFAALPLGTRLAGVKKMGRDVGEMWNVVSFAALSQYGWGMLLSIFVLGAFWQLHDGFGYLLATGFFGGHGTAAAVAASFKAYQWGDEAFSLGMSVATVGIICAIVPGVFLNNLAARKGWTREVSSPDEVEGVKGGDKELLTGLIPEGKRQPIGMETISGVSLESLSFHFAVIMTAAVAGWYANKYLKALWPAVDVPTFCLALFAAYILQLIMEMTRSDTYVDRKTINSVSGLAADYLIVAGMSAIKIALVVKYAVPFALLMIFGFGLCIFNVLVIGPKAYKEYWFERSMFVYGFSTGALVTSIILLRMIDPKMKSKSMETYAVVGLLDRPMFIALIALGPVLIGTGYAVHFAVACSILAVVPLVLARMVGWWYPKKALEVSGKDAIAESAQC
jgi:ESS family glutamate:Na+ symporter